MLGRRGILGYRSTLAGLVRARRGAGTSNMEALVEMTGLYGGERLRGDWCTWYKYRS
ncbi:hypothetical protein BAUCODRAFT_120092 [Baudoinia panamericana UAMH 10762]|uniref:Uncharacterized protein n=1 Tax=Baudoinia panamericana (strain UAMH 10762) TaxID=717646 RepID=M2NHH0_BAUPA|nr:uncharacterized protein BAUCODRAFT_120092 [Baudoinia panamericana UAMH 10762]EMC98794.1 hypothetical protein BAUCODRAFT_120092 [Baudoinia panamericana UAMH 10762]